MTVCRSIAFVTLAWLVCSLLTTSVAARAPAPRPTVPTTEARATFVDQPSETCELVGIDAEWNLKFQIGGKVRVVPSRELISWGTYRDREGGPQLLLVDGSVV